MPAPCKHPQVRVVAREDDVEFVECQLCGEVFDSAEFVDILNEDDAALSGGAAGGRGLDRASLPGAAGEKRTKRSLNAVNVLGVGRAR